MNREIVLDLETTGTDPRKGDRIVEIGCVELIDHLPTGQTYHQYVNPERKVSIGAYNVHKIENEFLKTCPTFKDIAGEFLNFIQDSALVIHNAPFDVGFIQEELKRIGQDPRYALRNPIVDTLMLARKKFPRSMNNLNALCSRYKIPIDSRKDKHGALIDSEILAKVYVELLGVKQQAMTFNLEQHGVVQNVSEFSSSLNTDAIKIHTVELTQSSIQQHCKILKNNVNEPIWDKFEESN